MSQFVEISFDCLPLRSVGRFELPVDSSPEHQALCTRIKRAADKHGLYNTYYLYQAKCVFHLTNDPEIGMIALHFEGTVLTDEDDSKTITCDLTTSLDGETCDWLTEPVVEWFSEAVGRAVQVEFDRYMAAGDLGKTVARLEQMHADSDEHGGFMGMGL